MKLRTLYQELCRRYPVSDACPGDVDGLQLCPDEDREIRRIVCALDLCADSVSFAIQTGADLLLTHHPVFYGGARSLDPAICPENRNVTRLMCASIAHISLHTRFDAGAGGMNDTLCALLGLENVGAIGLDDEPRALGRIGDLREQKSVEGFAVKVAKTLQSDVLLTRGSDTVKRVLVVTGSGKDYSDLFLASDADLFLSGETAHHVRVAVHDAGKSLIEAGHYGTEQIFMRALAPVVSKIDPALETIAFSDTPHETTVRFA